MWTLMFFIKTWLMSSTLHSTAHRGWEEHWHGSHAWDSAPIGQTSGQMSHDLFWLALCFFFSHCSVFFHFLLPRIYLWELMLNKIHMQRKAKWVKMEGVCRNRRWEVDFDAAVSYVRGLLPETNAKSFPYNLSMYMWWVSAVILFIYLQKNEWFGLRGNGRFFAWKKSVFYDLFPMNDVEICIFLLK